MNIDAQKNARYNYRCHKRERNSLKNENEYSVFKNLIDENIQFHLL